MSGLGQGAALTQALASFGKASVKGARFRTAISPEVNLGHDALFAGRRRTGGGAGEAWLRFVRPAVYIDTALGTRVIAPWGEPTRNWFPLLAGAAVVLTAVSVGAIIRGLRR
ncbi:MAG: hypothetical protein V3U45_03820 [bacterium]